MSDQQQNPKPNLISFIDAAKKRYYGHDYRELPQKQQLHLIDVVTHDDQVKKKELETEHGSDTY